MFCQNCGNQMEDNTKFCTSCGQEQDSIIESVEGDSETQQNQAPQQPQMDDPTQTQQQYQTTPPQQTPMNIQKSKMSKVPLVIIAVIVVAIAGLLVYGYMQSTPVAGAQRFFTALVHKDANGAINNVYIPKGTTTEQKTSFKKSVSEFDTSKIDVNTLKISATKPTGFTTKPETSITVDDKATKDFQTVYITIKFNGKSETSIGYMLKQGKNFLIFDKWVVKY